MSVRKRTWKTSAGEAREAWVVDYFDQHGKRCFKTFQYKRKADNFAAQTRVEVRDGLHVAENASATISKAGELWLKSAEAHGLERATLDQYRQHLNLHIVPFIGNMKLSQMNAPTVRAFEDKLRENVPRQ